jgi:rfaE bifunctional protein nucleotidyltransferase chain/domain
MSRARRESFFSVNYNVNFWVQSDRLALRPEPLVTGRPKVIEGRRATLKSLGRLYNRTELLEQRTRWKDKGQTVAFTNGCYDVLHPGHIRLIEYARSCADVLIVALNTDTGVKRLKGQSRPLIPEQERAELMAALEAVDAVILFDEDTPRELIAELLPDVLMKGADWSHFISGREEVEAAGGKVIAAPLRTGYSTTSILEKLLTLQP